MDYTTRIDRVKQAAAGRWGEILVRVGGVPDKLFDSKNHPCPKCGGTDRFRFINRDAGALYCNQCFNTKNGDGIAAVQWLTGCTFGESLAAIEQHLGINGTATSGKKRKRAYRPDSEIVASYDYHVADGTRIYQSCRFENPKDFCQRQPKPGGGWIRNLKGVTPVLYRLPELLAADPSTIVFVAEGEKDVDRLVSIGLVATCNPMGAEKWRDEYSDHLAGRHVVVLVDNDAAGRRHAAKVARSLYGKAASIKVVELPELPPAGDVSDWLDGGGTAGKLLDIAQHAPEWQPSDEGNEGDENDDDAPTKPRITAATALVKEVLAAGVELWHTPGGDAYATVPIGDHHEHVPVRSKPFRRWLARLHYESSRKAASGQVVADATAVIEGKACFDGDEHAVHVRIAGHDGDIYFDLCDARWRAAHITRRGWHIVESPPVRFRRAKAMLPLCEPQRGGKVDELNRWFRIGDDITLVLAWLVAAMRNHGPYPVLPLHGEQGSGKSTRARMLRELLDPNTAPLRAEPREPRDLMIAANNGWVIALDNLSMMSAWLSDALCRLSTGGGFSTRTLYENDEETIFHAMRPIVLTGIEEIVTRGDLLDRSMPISLPVIPETERLPESVLWREFNEAKPRILGGLLDAVVVALANEHRVVLDKLPRMADFAVWATAAESGLGLPPGRFIRIYTGNRESANELALESSPLVKYVRKLLDESPEWSGTASDLLAELDELATDKDRGLKSWPHAGQVLTGRLKRIAPNLRQAGIDVHFTRATGGRRIVSIRKVRDSSVTTVTGVTEPEKQGESSDAPRDASDASPSGGASEASLENSRFAEENASSDARDTSDAVFPNLSHVRVRV